MQNKNAQKGRICKAHQYSPLHRRILIKAGAYKREENKGECNFRIRK